MRKLICVVALLFLALSVWALPTTNTTQSVGLAWNPSPDTNVTGYRVYYGVASRTYTNVVDVGNFTNCTISGLKMGVVYFFAATAYNSIGMESDYSNEVSYNVPRPPVAPSNLRTASIETRKEQLYADIRRRLYPKPLFS